MYKIDNQQGPTIWQDNCTQSFVITYQGKGSGKKKVHASLCLAPETQHCRSAILKNSILKKKLTGDSNVKPSLRITGEEKLRNLRIGSES